MLSDLRCECRLREQEFHDKIKPAFLGVCIQMQKRLRTQVPLLFLSLGFLAASTVAPLNFAQLSALAHRVAIGRVERITSYEERQTGRILSRVEISPTRSLAGAASLSPVTFEMTGGTVGDRRQWIAGFPSLRVGDHLVLFLAEDTSTPFGPTVGLWQGVFFIETDPTTGVETIADHRRRPVSEIRGEELVLSETRQGSRLTLDAFVDRILAQRRQGRKENLK